MANKNTFKKNETTAEKIKKEIVKTALEQSSLIPKSKNKNSVADSVVKNTKVPIKDEKIAVSDEQLSTIVKNSVAKPSTAEKLKPTKKKKTSASKPKTEQNMPKPTVKQAVDFAVSEIQKRPVWDISRQDLTSALNNPTAATLPQQIGLMQKRDEYIKLADKKTKEANRITPADSRMVHETGVKRTKSNDDKPGFSGISKNEQKRMKLTGEAGEARAKANMYADVLDEIKRDNQYKSLDSKYMEAARKGGGSQKFVRDEKEENRKFRIGTSDYEKYKYINGGYSDSEINASKGNALANGGSSMFAKFESAGYDTMTMRERGIYTSLYNKDKKKAEEYLKELEPYLNRRATERDVTNIKKVAEKSPAAASAYSVVGNLASGIGAIENAGEYITGVFGNEVDTYDATSRIARVSQAARHTVGENLNRKYKSSVPSAMYDIGMSIADNLANVALLGPAGSAAVAANMSLGAATNGMIDAADAGGSNTQIFLSGLAQGTAEYLFEKINIDKLFEIKNVRGWKNALKAAGAQMLTEGSEELNTEIANIMTNAAIMGDRSETQQRIRQYMEHDMSYAEAQRQAFKDNIHQVIMAGIGGAISGGIMGGGRIAIDSGMTEYDNRRIGKSIIKNGNAIGMLNIADESGNPQTQAEAQKQREKAYIKGNPSAGAIGRIAQNLIVRELYANSTNGDINVNNDIQTAQSIARSLLGKQTPDDVMRIVSSQAALKTFDRLANDEQFYHAVVGNPKTAQTEDVTSAETVTETMPDIETTAAESETITESPTEKKSVPVTPARREIVENDGAREWRQRDSQSYDNAAEMAKRLGVKIEVVDNLRDGKGNILDGDIRGSRIHIRRGSENPVRWIYTHEFTHRMKKASPTTWDRYQSYVIDYWNEQGEYDTKVQAIKNIYKTEDMDYINEEIACDFGEEMFGEENGEQIISDMLRTDRTLAQKIKTWWCLLLEKFGRKKELATARDLWDRCLKEAERNLEVDRTVPHTESASRMYNRSTSIDKSIPQPENLVNNNFMQNQKNNAEDAKSSIAGVREEENRLRQERLEKENERLRKRVEDMDMQIREYQRRTVNYTAVNDVAKALKEAYHTNMNASTIANSLYKLYNTMSADNVDGDAVGQEAAKIAKAMMSDTVTEIDTSAYDQYSDLLERIRKTRISVPESERADFKDGYEYYRKHHSWGNLLLTNDGMPLDAFWEEIAHDYPELIMSDDIIGSEARLDFLIDLKKEFAPIENTYYGEYSHQAEMALRNDILDAFFKIPEKKSGKVRVTYDSRSMYAEEALKNIQEKYEKSMATAKENMERRIATAKENMERRIAAEIARAEGEVERTSKKAESAERRLENYKRRAEFYRDRKKMRDTITRETSYINKLLLEPKGPAGVPQHMREAVAGIMSLFDFETRQSDKIMNETGKPSNLSVKLADLQDKYHRIISSAWNIRDAETAEQLDSALNAELSHMIADIPIVTDGKSKRLQDMNIKELELVCKVLQSVHHAIVSHNKFFSGFTKDTISQVGEQAINDTTSERRLRADKKKGKVSGDKVESDNSVARTFDKVMNYDIIQPWDMFHGLGATMERLYMNERNAFDRHVQQIKQASEVIQAAIKGMKMSEITGKNAKAEYYSTVDGKIGLTKAQVMSLWALYKREAGKRHILEGGILADKSQDENGNATSAGTVHHVTEEQFGEIFKVLTDEEKKAATEIVRFMSDECASWGNEASMKLFGYEKFGEKWYFPIKVNDTSLATFYGEKGEGNLRNQGFTKTLNRYAHNAVSIGDFFDIATNHIAGMSLYNTVALPMLDMERVLNYNNGDATVRQEIIRTYGREAEKYIKKFHQDINHSARAAEADPVIEKLLGNAKAAAIGLNVRVFLQQPTSIVRAFMFLNAGDFAGIKYSKAAKEEMQSHSSIAWWKAQGYRDIEVGRELKDVMTGRESLYDKLAMGGYGAADDFTWTIIWQAVKKNVEHNDSKITVGSEEYWRKVNAKFNEVIDRSQVVDSVFHRSQNMRSKNQYTKAATMFMSEPIKTLNMYRTVLIDAERDKKLPKVLPKATTVYIISNLVLAAAQAIPDVWREKEWEDEAIWQMYIKKLGGNFIENLLPTGLIPYVNTFQSMLQGFGNDRMEYSSLSKLLDSVKRLIDGNRSIQSRVIDVANAVAAVFGISTGTAYREIMGIYRMVDRQIRKESAKYDMLKWDKNVKSSDNTGKVMKLYNSALENGRADYAAEIMEDYLESIGAENPKIDSKVYKEIGRLYKKTGDMSIIFRLPDDDFDVGEKSFNLKGEAYADYAAEYEKILREEEGKVIGSKAYDDMDDEKKTDAIKTAMQYAKDVAKTTVDKKYEPDSWKGKVYHGEQDIMDYIMSRQYDSDVDAIGKKLYDIYKNDSGNYDKKFKELSDGYAQKEVYDAIAKYVKQSNEYKKMYHDGIAQIKDNTGDYTSDTKEAAKEWKKQFAADAANQKYVPNYQRASAYAWITKYQSGAADFMPVEDFIDIKAKLREIEWADEKTGFKKAELVALIDGTGRSRDEKRKLFTSLARSNMRNPY